MTLGQSYDISGLGFLWGLTLEKVSLAQATEKRYQQQRGLKMFMNDCISGMQREALDPEWRGNC